LHEARAKRNRGGYELYYRDVGRVTGTPLTPELELELFYKHRDDHDERARDRLIHNCLRQVIKIAHQFTQENVSTEQLISAGNVGIMHALDKYDPSYNTRFLSYATYWIKHYIKMELLDRHIVTIPPLQQKLRSQISRVQENYRAQCGELAGMSHVCHVLGITEKQMSRNSMLHTEQHEYRIGQLKTSQTNALYATGTNGTNSIEELLGNRELKRSLDLVISMLPVKDQFVIRAYYGMLGTPLTLKQIARYLCLSSERVRQLKVIALRRLQRAAKRYWGQELEYVRDWIA